MPYERLLVSADSDAEDSDAEESTSAANQVPVGLTGKVLASFLLSERDNSAFAKAFENGIMGPLTAYRLRLCHGRQLECNALSSVLPEDTQRLNLAGGHLKLTGVPFSIVSNTNVDTSTRSFLDDPADRELRASRIDRELHAKPSSALRCPHTFPRAATPDGTRALTTRRR